MPHVTGWSFPTALLPMETGKWREIVKKISSEFIYFCILSPLSPFLFICSSGFILFILYFFLPLSLFYSLSVSAASKTTRENEVLLHPFLQVFSSGTLCSHLDVVWRSVLHCRYGVHGEELEKINSR